MAEAEQRSAKADEVDTCTNPVRDLNQIIHAGWAMSSAKPNLAKLFALLTAKKPPRRAADEADTCTNPAGI